MHCYSIPRTVPFSKPDVETFEHMEKLPMHGTALLKVKLSHSAHLLVSRWSCLCSLERTGQVECNAIQTVHIQLTQAPITLEKDVPSDKSLNPTESKIELRIHIYSWVRKSVMGFFYLYFKTICLYSNSMLSSVLLVHVGTFSVF